VGQIAKFAGAHVLRVHGFSSRPLKVSRFIGFEGSQ
jgi:hypothetical protein